MPTLNILSVLAQHPLGLVFDIDGTLSPYVPKPHEARLYPGVSSLLEQVSNHAHVGILTSRTIEDAAAMVNIDNLTYMGTYGMEWCDGLPSSQSVQIMPEALAYIKHGKYLLDMVEHELSELPGIIVEQHRFGGVVHYQYCLDPEEARQKILSLLKEPTRQVNMCLIEGERVAEVKPPLTEGKGRALRQFVQRFGLHGVIFAGDDRPDLNAFLEISRLRKEGIASLSILVQHVNTVPELLEYADIVVQEVEGMVDLLRKIVNFM